MELRIDPEFESKIPPLTADELVRLHGNILTEGAAHQSHRCLKRHYCGRSHSFFRWNFCKSNYPAFFELAECLSEIRKLIRNGHEFLTQYEEKLPCDNSTDVREITEVPPTALYQQGRRKVLPERHLQTTAEIAA